MLNRLKTVPIAYVFAALVLVAILIMWLGSRKPTDVPAPLPQRPKSTVIKSAPTSRQSSADARLREYERLYPTRHDTTH